MGNRCHLYNDYQELFTKEYAWEHCKHMQLLRWHIKDVSLRQTALDYTHGSG